mgnify:CR=1 FL=1
MAVLTNSLALFKSAASGNLAGGSDAGISAYLADTLPSSYEARDSYQNYGGEIISQSYSYSYDE